MRRILLLSTTTGYQLRSFNDAAERLGIELVFATDRCHTLEDPWQDSAIAVRFHEEPESLRAIVEAARQRPIHGVVAVGDRPVVLAARASEALGIRGNPPAAAAASANKLLTRQCFAAANIPVPWFFVVPAGATTRAIIDDPRLSFPCVAKPLGLSGSRGVIRADSRSDLARAIDRVRALLTATDIRALRTGLESDILIEGYIEGREYAVEGVLTNGTLQVFAIFDKPDPLDGPFFEETIYVTPSALPVAVQRNVEREVGRAVRALGLRHGPVHAECRIGPSTRLGPGPSAGLGPGTATGLGRGPQGIVVLEIAARPIGGLCSRALRFGAYEGDVPLEEVLLRHAVGEDVARWQRERAAAAVMMIPIPTRGILKRVEGEDQARRVTGVEDVKITAKPDQLLEMLPEAGSYLGFIFARAATAQQAEDAVRKAHRRLRFVIDPAITLVS